MLLSSGAPPAGDEWAAEVKWDGMRAQLRVDRGRVCLRSRPGRDCTAEFGEVAEIAAQVGRRRRLVVGGGVGCFASGGAPDFAALRARLGSRRARPPRSTATFVIFDVLHADGRGVRV